MLVEGTAFGPYGFDTLGYRLKRICYFLGCRSEKNLPYCCPPLRIMEERYEIRGKIGQGGLGVVYRGYDTRMSREVAIKRIPVADSDPKLKEESTRQLIKEAGALASLQHPHIVTIHDVGSDDDGPYVVMELISGKTLDELIERAPLTWADFRELALQTQEALIAAQDLNLIHSDIKPSNLMLTWLPSGKIQVKIVDFGLATLTQSESLEELQKVDAVFGSIFFMAPEQFERIPIDARTDMYALGCVFYQALTGEYPFTGETVNEVMTSHLEHQVTPIQEIRADIPLWACDWIMWHVNRQADDRPENARYALQVFLQNDKIINQPMSRGKAGPVIPVGPRPRVVGAAIEVPAGISPEAAARAVLASPESVPPAPVTPVEALRSKSPPTKTAPQALLPPEGSKPSVYVPPKEPVPVAPTRQIQSPPTSKRASVTPKKNNSRTTAKVAGVTVSAIIAGVVAFFLISRILESRGSDRIANILLEAANPKTRELPMTGEEVTQLLAAVTNANSDEERVKIYRALTLAKSSDDTDLGASIAEFTTESVQILPEVRERLMSDVLAKRPAPSIVPALTAFARTTNDTRSALAALKAVRTVVGDEQFEPLLAVTQFHPNPEIRKAAEEGALEIIRKSKKRSDLFNLVNTAVEATSNSKIRKALLRLRAASSGY